MITEAQYDYLTVYDGKPSEYFSGAPLLIWIDSKLYHASFCNRCIQADI